MKSIVITGSTSGIGLGLADSFLSLGCSVTVSGHSQENLNKAYSFLATKYEQSRLLAHICDVTGFDQVQALWDETKARFGNVHIWINNAGVGHAEIGVQD